MKKFAAIALAASMVLGLSGCGSSGSAQTSDNRHSGASNLFFFPQYHSLGSSPPSGIA